MSKAKENIDDIFGVLKKKRKNDPNYDDINDTSLPTTTKSIKSKTPKNLTSVPNTKAETNGSLQTNPVLKSKTSSKMSKSKAAEEKHIVSIDKSSQNFNEKESTASYGVIKSNAPGGKSWITSPEAPLERLDKESGLPVYKAHLLKVGDGGGNAFDYFLKIREIFA